MTCDNFLIPLRRERLKFGLDLRVVPVRMFHGCLQIVDHQPFRHAAELLKGVLNGGDEIICRLTPDPSL